MPRISSETLSLWPLFQKIKGLEGTEVELFMSSTSPLLENYLALYILKEESLAIGKKISFLFEDKNFADLSQRLNGPIPARPIEPTALTPEVPESNSEKPLTGRKIEIKTLFRPRVSLGFNKGLLLLLVPVAVVLVSGLAYYYFSRAKISLYLSSESLVKTIDVVALTKADQVLEDPPTIPALEIATSLQKSESSPSSGKKEIGEKATGNVLIYNKTTSVASFPAGTTLAKGRVAGDDLRYVTKEKIEVPARTADSTAVSGYQPGTASASVAAEKLGDEYNLVAGETFSVSTKSTNDFIAQNLADLVGGSRRQVVVVTLEDQRKLYDQILNILKDELKKNVAAKVVTGQVLEEESITYETVTKSYDRSVGDEADRLTLNLEVSAKALAFLKSDLDKLAAKLLASFVPDGYELFGGEQMVEVSQTEALVGKLKILARAKGFIVPQVDADEVSRKLTGQNVAFAKDYLGSLKKINSYSIERFPDISFLPFLPFRYENLRIEVVRK